MSKILFTNGKIWTADEAVPNAENMLVEDGKVAWIGNDLSACDTTADETIDLKGARVVPGLIDSHMHPLMLAEAAEKIACLPPEIMSIADLIPKIRQVREEKGPDCWIQGWGYDESKLAEGRLITKYDLDQGASDVPVVMVRSCVHIYSVNSKMLEMAGITKDTPDPMGGIIERDENGEPNGILKEAARNLVMDMLPVSDVEKTSDRIVSLGKKLATLGITSIDDSMSKYVPEDSGIYYEEAAKKGLKTKIAQYYNWFQTEEKLKNGTLPADLKERYDKSKIHFQAGIKILCDGSISGRTAWMDRPYKDEPDNYGLCSVKKEDLINAADYAMKEGIQLQLHAMGTRTVDMIIDTLKDYPKWTKDCPHIRIEHVTEPSAWAIKTAAEKGIAFTTQPVFLFSEIENYSKYIGEKYLPQLYPFRSIMDGGVTLAFGSDAPATAWAEPADPFIGMYFAVTRKSWDGTDCSRKEAITVEEALKAYTCNAAYILGLGEKGRLAKGFDADFVVLDKDILSIDPEDIRNTRPAATYIGGQCVYEA